MALNEADTCRVYVTPRLKEAGWDSPPHSLTEQKTFTDGRVFAVGGNITRGPQKRADYVLRYTRDFMIAVVEAKEEGVAAGTGLQQAKDYAETLGLKFAYATNGQDILEFDYLTGAERLLSAFPSPDELWARLRKAEGPALPDGTPAAHKRVARVLWNDPGTGVMRHADAGYRIAIDCAREQGLNLPMIGTGGTP